MKNTTTTNCIELVLYESASGLDFSNTNNNKTVFCRGGWGVVSFESSHHAPDVSDIFIEKSERI